MNSAPVLFVAFVLYQTALEKAKVKPRTEREVRDYIDKALEWTRQKNQAPELAHELETKGLPLELAAWGRIRCSSTGYYSFVDVLREAQAPLTVCEALKRAPELRPHFKRTRIGEKKNPESALSFPGVCLLMTSLAGLEHRPGRGALSGEVVGNFETVAKTPPAPKPPKSDERPRIPRAWNPHHWAFADELRERVQAGEKLTEQELKFIEWEVRAWRSFKAKRETQLAAVKKGLRSS